MNLITLDTKLSQVQGILPKFLVKLNKLEIHTVYDLLRHFPARYEDFSKVSKITDLKSGEQVTIRAEVRRISSRKTWKSSMQIVEALVTDETGGITLVWFNQPFIGKVLKEGMRVNFAGKVFENKTGLHISNPSYEIVKGTSEMRHTAGLIPVYPETRGLTSKGIRYLVKNFLDIIEFIPDFIPEEVLVERGLPDLNSALRKVHFPKSPDAAERAKTRFAFEYVFLIQLNNLKSREQLSRENAPALPVSDSERAKILGMLPFTLTESQRRSLDEIILDIARPRPMNRLLQGDVGSGKTAVSAVAAVIAAHSNTQAVFMAPTEVLARQHYHTLTGVFKNFDKGIALLTGSESRIYLGEGLETKKTKAALIKDIETGAVAITIGTHALIAESKKTKTKKAQPKITFPNPGLIVIDEQHRFGVSQRAALLQHKDARSMLPHFLSMSATPIPRTLTLAIFGDLDVSTINELPSGRKAIITKIVDPINRPKAYGFIKQQIAAGRQAFFIYPRIEASQAEPKEIGHLMTAGTKSMWNEVKAVKAEYEKLSTTIFPDLEVAMLHGKMKAQDKAKTMADFKAGKIDILVSTSVIEVGVDVPNATIMIVEGADRFGLAQLYQFRGRVGRGQHQSFCFLFTDSTGESTMVRLNALLEAKNGFELAEKDLEIRGPGQFLGDKQTGVPDFAMQSLNNIELIKSARDSAQKILEKDPDLKNYPLLKQKLASLSKQIHLE